jgi:predicted enzyme related to lactoylglutathione lyase
VSHIIHFEFPALDPEKSVQFYRSVFGWEITRWAGPVDYWLTTTGPEGKAGINGAIVRRRDFISPHTVVTLDVPSVDDFIAKIISAGGKVIMPKHAIPGVGYNAYCADPSGIIFGIMQDDPSAG